MTIFTYEFGSENLEWNDKTSFRKHEIDYLNTSIQSLHYILEDIENEITENEKMRVCSIKLYQPHRLADTMYILTVPRAKIYHKTDSRNVTEQVSSLLDKREDVILCQSEEDMEQEFEEALE